MSIIKGDIIHFASIVTSGFEMLLLKQYFDIRSFVIHLIHVTYKLPLLEIFASTHERVLLSSFTNHRLYPSFAAVQTLLAIGLKGRYVFHHLHGSFV